MLVGRLVVESVSQEGQQESCMQKNIFNKIINVVNNITGRTTINRYARSHVIQALAIGTGNAFKQRKFYSYRKPIIMLFFSV
jgi:hypothetical protein